MLTYACTIPWVTHTHITEVCYDSIDGDTDIHAVQRSLCAGHQITCGEWKQRNGREPSSARLSSAGITPAVAAAGAPAIVPEDASSTKCCLENGQRLEANGSIFGFLTKAFTSTARAYLLTADVRLNRKERFSIRRTILR